DLAVTDLSACDDPEGRARAEALQEAGRPFDIKRELPIRAGLLRLAKDDHLLLVTLHHIASDGWSIGVMMSELAALYEAFVAGRPPALADLPLQYRDFAVWQRNHLQGQLLQTQLDYWKRYLDGAPGRLALPLDRPRPPTLTHRGARVR